jgi:hypothetical protein
VNEHAPALREHSARALDPAQSAFGLPPGHLASKRAHAVGDVFGQSRQQRHFLCVEGVGGARIYAEAADRTSVDIEREADQRLKAPLERANA